MKTEITPASVAALPDAELNELAATLVMGWQRQEYRWVDRDGSFNSPYMCNPDYNYLPTSDAQYRVFKPVDNDGHAFMLVDRLREEYRFTIQQGYEKWGVSVILDDGEIDPVPFIETCHTTRARAITEACVLAAASKEQL